MNILYILDYLILTTTLKVGPTYHPHFTDEEIDSDVKCLVDGHTEVAQDGVRI